MVSDSLRPHGLRPARLPCPSPPPGVFSDHHQTHPQPSVASALAQPLHSFWSYYQLPSALPKQHIGHLLTWRAHLPVLFLFALSYSLCVLTARIPGWFAVPSPSGHHYCAPSLGTGSTQDPLVVPAHWQPAVKDAPLVVLCQSGSRPLTTS